MVWVIWVTLGILSALIRHWTVGQEQAQPEDKQSVTRKSLVTLCIVGVMMPLVRLRGQMLYMVQMTCLVHHHRPPVTSTSIPINDRIICKDKNTCRLKEKAPGNKRRKERRVNPIPKCNGDSRWCLSPLELVPVLHCPFAQ